MGPDELNVLIDRAAERLGQNGGEVRSVQDLRRHPVLYEVVGKWPPDAPLEATPAEVDKAADAVERAIQALEQTAPAKPVTSEFRRLLSRLQESRQQAFDDGGVRDLEGGSPSAPSATPLGIVGRWPPE